MKRLQHTAPILLAALFWLAQLQGTWHSVSHLGEATHTQDRAHTTHTASCLDCASLAQAGGAPITATNSAPLLQVRDDLTAPRASKLTLTRARVAYHSLAPPSTLS